MHPDPLVINNNPERKNPMSDYSRDAERQLWLEADQQRQAEMDEAWAQYEAQQQSAAENGFAR